MSLPEDVIVDVLSKLPVKSLLRFKCVCKSWYEIINDPTFVLKHRETISKTPRLDIAVISRRDNITNKRVVSVLTSTNDGGDEVLMDLNLPTFLNEMFGHVRLIGPCNGVVCLYGYPDNIALWNPGIRDFKILPQSQLPRPPNSKVRGGDLGVGFDSKTRDLKVIQLLFCVSSDCSMVCQVEIYSLKSDSWKNHGTYVPANVMSYNLSSMVFKNESFCWWALDMNNAEVILSFDMSKEIFETTPLPPTIEDLGGQHRITRAIFPMKEALALVVYGQRDVDKVFDVWTIRELGGSSDCWSRVRSIGPISTVEKPLGFWNDYGIFLENSDGEMVLYNRVNREFKNFGIYGKRSRLEIIILRETLFSTN